MWVITEDWMWLISFLIYSLIFKGKALFSSYSVSIYGSVIRVVSDCFDPRVETRYMREMMKRAARMYLRIVSFRGLQRLMFGVG